MTLYYGPARGHLRVVKAMRDPAAAKASAVLDALRSFLKTEEPTVMRWLRSLWEVQQNAVTYGQIRDDILQGTLTIDLLKQWQEDYARFVTEKLAPKWREAMQAAAREQVKKDGFQFDLTTPEIDRWIEEHGTELAVDLTEAQHTALKVVIEQAAHGQYGPDELARVIRPLIGMTERNIKACERYYESLRAEGMKADQARERAMNYAANAHRYRAQNIARTELASAFNHGADAAIRQAQAQGYIGKVKKRWVTAEDERVCDYCGPLDGVAVDHDDDFPGADKVPPRHPSCRCVVVYEEVDEHGRSG
ncbi:MAG: phage head morphogenesis protein [Alicyclobacillus macrosporangiidus]|uniref:phage minor head protein n=1 Tax=Alicyclobacillus macrosporangiidus TaxID=392015 RepID=UPI0026EE7CD9|nr:phage minor head protein [Alicyclobacillus macrosporangiidus]MCL6597953.1 phage head morphogenesis protein [Alicyclobacillus macrosporangiidus]